ncbi:caspase family protein [Streptomyces sp. Rer75]|uniref:caspase family protein n=1 Tax=Streptomyces sp. Rer75 TaxID=2750011 RepID=UPI0015D0A77A|nr:caspase family protein [Streptomyces sp. Rer75]QLH22539.1 caspase family protein [Streptomyces sp. Rer75]
MTTRYKALLIGASDYDEPAISSLPFVRDDLQRLATALTDRGFHSAEIAEHRRGITLNFVKDQVSRFLREAKRHDTLFILLSGHGQHFQGTDYLIPEDASFQVHPFADSCVPLDWSKQLNECAAAQVVFLIDACREGIEQDSMGPAGVEGWRRANRSRPWTAGSPVCMHAPRASSPCSSTTRRTSKKARTSGRHPMSHSACSPAPCAMWSAAERTPCT